MSTILPRLGIFLCTFIGASTIVVAEPLMPDIPAIFLLAVRFIAAALLLALLLPRKVFPLTRHAVQAGITSGFGFGLGSALMYIALAHVRAGKLTFLIALEVVIVPVVCWALFGQRLSKLEKLALLPAVFGLWLISGNAEVWFSWWELVALLSACAYAIYTISLSSVHSHAGVASKTFVSFVSIGLLSFVASLLLEQSSSVVWSSSAIAGVLYLVIVGSIMRFLIQAWAQKSVSASFTALTFTAEPVFAIGLSYTLLGERFTVTQTCGAVVIITAVVLANYPVKSDEIVPA